ncbi:hypothetical protein [Xenorhabdus lircayensis]|uniref:Uncharacterized protein n=1 Tax=Xenorhabdus lircayensis TaxID=2763499 RepID=A0ABS0U1D8_9GAMM|nr:hypothetical protein [Xenorhabdus lircayensis]MBI6547696.1 hypothetical protein [Xenorhabdus lircayensis]
MNILNDNDTLLNKCSSGNLCVSIPSGSDIIIGQSVYLTITLLAAPEVIKDVKKIQIKNNTNVVTAIRHTPWTLTEDKTQGSAVFLLKINNELLPETDVIYTVHAISRSGMGDVQGIDPLNVTYTAKQISHGSGIQLSSDTNYMVTPTTDNSMDSPNSKYALISSTLIDDKGNALKNVALTISAFPPNKLELVCFSTNENPRRRIKTQSKDKINFLTVYSDEEGKIKFRIYPKQYTQVRLDLTTEILDVTGANPAYTLYVFSYPQNSPSTLGPPTIQELDGNNILKNSLISPSEKFHVTIPSYQPAYAQDVALFFIKKGMHDQSKLLEPIYPIKNVSDLPDKAFTFSYKDLPLNEEVDFYYIISSIDGDIKISYPLTVKYLGSEKEKNPFEIIPRVYAKIDKIYSSYATLPINLSSSDNKLSEENDITLDMIAQKRHHQSEGAGAPGLYLYIEGSYAPTNKELPRLSQSGEVNLYLRSSTRKIVRNYNFTLPNLNDPGRTTGSVLVTIPYCDLNRAAAYQDHPGHLYIDYYVNDDDGMKIYSKVWNVEIETAEQYDDPSELDGCPLGDDHMDWDDN